MEKTAFQLAMEKAIADKQAKGEKLSPELSFREGQEVRAVITYVAHVLDTKRKKDREFDVEFVHTTEPFVWKKGESDRDWQEYVFLTDIVAPQAINDGTVRVKYTWVKDVKYVAAEV